LLTCRITPRLFILSASILLSSTNLQPVHAQDGSAAISLPDALEPLQVSSQAPATSPQQSVDTGKISGTVTDRDGAVVQGARVELTGPAQAKSTQVSSAEGQFDFPGLPAAVYKITVAGEGMSTAATDEIALGAGEYRTLPNITLSVSGGVTSVTVSGDKEELSQQQV
jgi:hypothetical protein